MNVSLTPELEQYVKSKVESGLYQSASEVFRAALRLHRDRDAQRQERLEDLRREIALGIEDLDQGHFSILDEAAIERIKKRARSDRAE